MSITEQASEALRRSYFVAVTIHDKPNLEQINMIDQLDEEDRTEKINLLIVHTPGQICLFKAAC